MEEVDGIIDKAREIQGLKKEINERFKFGKRLCGNRGLGRYGSSGVIKIRSFFTLQLANEEGKIELMDCKIIKGSG